MDEKMEGSLYHYTDLNTFSKIVSSGCLKFRSSRYDEIDKSKAKDECWLKKNEEQILRHICQTEGKKYEETMSFVPYVICFCKNGVIKKMWQQYGDNNKGIVFKLNSKIIHEFALSVKPEQSRNPDIILPCEYITQEEAEDTEAICKKLKDLYNRRTNITINDYTGDYTESIACLKQSEYNHENEVRYLITNYCYESSNYNDWENDNDNFIKTYEDLTQVIEEEGKSFIYRKFPKESLAGILLGHQTSIEDYNMVKETLQNNGFNLNNIEIRKITERELLTKKKQV